MHILIVEDEVRLADALEQIMVQQKYLVDVVHDGEDGLAYALAAEYDVIVLDIMLPGKTGLEVVRELRRQKISTPVLLLTARDELSDKVQGLDMGADDYMTKPFSPDELLARIRALSRRLGEVVSEELSFADITLRLSTCELCCGIKSIRLGFKEFEILKLFLSHPDGILSKGQLIERVWGSNSEAEDNNVEAYISFLRKKLFFVHSRVTIATIRKIGYRLEVES